MCLICKGTVKQDEMERTNSQSSVTQAVVKLKSMEEEVFEIPKDVTILCVTLHNIIEDSGGDDTKIISLPMKSKTLVKIIEYCTYHHMAQQTSIPLNKVSEWDKKFVQVDDPILPPSQWSNLFDLTMAANYLDVKSLLDLTCQAWADELTAKTPDEIRSRFNLKDDLTPGKKEEIMKNNVWWENEHIY